MDRKDLLVVTGSDSSDTLCSMLEVSLRYLNAHNYDVALYDFGGLGKGKALPYKERPNYYKTSALIDAWDQGRPMIWMDADSMMLKPVDEIFDNNFDVAIPIKDKSEATKLYGKYFYSGFLAFYPTFAALGWLKRWDSVLYKSTSDQRTLQKTMGSYTYLTDAIYTLRGKRENIKGTVFKYLDDKVYVAMSPIANMRDVNSHEKVIHFKGQQYKKQWRHYRDRFLDVG